MQQLALTFVVPEEENPDRITYARRFQIFDYFERQEGKTAYVRYRDGLMSFTVPVVIGQMRFSTYISGEPGNLKCYQMRSNESIIKFAHQVTSISVEQNRVEAIYSRHEFNQKDGYDIEGIAGKAVIELVELDKIKMKKHAPAAFAKKDIVGRRVQLCLHIADDWISGVQTLPFQVTGLERSGDTLRLTGSHGVELTYKGVAGFRHSAAYTIVDIQDPWGRMDRSFTVWYETPANF